MADVQRNVLLDDNDTVPSLILRGTAMRYTECCL